MGNRKDGDCIQPFITSSSNHEATVFESMEPLDFPQRRKDLTRLSVTGAAKARPWALHANSSAENAGNFTGQIGLLGPGPSLVALAPLFVTPWLHQADSVLFLMPMPGLCLHVTLPFSFLTSFVSSSPKDNFFY